MKKSGTGILVLIMFITQINFRGNSDFDLEVKSALKVFTRFYALDWSNFLKVMKNQSLWHQKLEKRGRMLQMTKCTPTIERKRESAVKLPCLPLYVVYLCTHNEDPCRGSCWRSSRILLLKAAAGKTKKNFTKSVLF